MLWESRFSWYPASFFGGKPQTRSTISTSAKKLSVKRETNSLRASSAVQQPFLFHTCRLLPWFRFLLQPSSSNSSFQLIPSPSLEFSLKLCLNSFASPALPTTMSLVFFKAKPPNMLQSSTPTSSAHLRPSAQSPTLAAPLALRHAVCRAASLLFPTRDASCPSSPNHSPKKVGSTFPSKSDRRSPLVFAS